MSEVEALRAKVAEKDRAIHQQDVTITQLEDALHEAQRVAKQSGAALQRLQAAQQTLEGRLAKAKESERDALVKLAKLQKEGGGGGGGKGAAPADDDNAAQQQQQQQSAAEAYLWKATAQVVLSSYKRHMETILDENAEWNSITRHHSNFLCEASLRATMQCDALIRSQHTASKISDLDHDKRMEQFKELTDLRERCIILDREKAVLARELKVLDESFVEFECKVKDLTRANETLRRDNDTLRVEVHKMSFAIANNASLSGIIQRSSNSSAGASSGMTLGTPRGGGGVSQRRSSGPGKPASPHNNKNNVTFGALNLSSPSSLESPSSLFLNTPSAQVFSSSAHAAAAGHDAVASGREEGHVSDVERSFLREQSEARHRIHTLELELQAARKESEVTSAQLRKTQRGQQGTVDALRGMNSDSLRQRDALVKELRSQQAANPVVETTLIAQKRVESDRKIHALTRQVAEMQYVLEEKDASLKQTQERVEAYYSDAIQQQAALSSSAAGESQQRGGDRGYALGMRSPFPAGDGDPNTDTHR